MRDINDGDNTTPSTNTDGFSGIGHSPNLKSFRTGNFAQKTTAKSRDLVGFSEGAEELSMELHDFIVARTDSTASAVAILRQVADALNSSSTALALRFSGLGL